MTSNQLFLQVLKQMSRRKMNDVRIRLDCREASTEGYEIYIPRDFFEMRNVEFLCDECNSMSMWMKVQYKDDETHAYMDVTEAPSSITFYSDKYQTPIITYRINTSVGKLFGINTKHVDDPYLLKVIRKIILPLFKGIYNKLIFLLVERMQ